MLQTVNTAMSTVCEAVEVKGVSLIQKLPESQWRDTNKFSCIQTTSYSHA